MKIQTIFSDLVGGPLAGFIDLLGSALSVINLILQPIGFIAGAVAKIASFDFKNMSVLQGIVGGIVALLGIMRLRVVAINMARKIGLMTEKGISFQNTMQLAKKKGQMIIDKGLLFFGIKRRGAEAAVNVQKTIGNRKGIFGLLRSAGQFVMKMFTAGASAPPPSNLVLPFVLGAIGGAIAAALVSKFSKGDDVFSGGYGKRTLLMPEGAIALNDKDTVIAGTNISKGDDVIQGNIAPPEPFDYERMAAASANHTVNATMNYQSYAARDVHGGVSYGNFVKKNKIP